MITDLTKLNRNQVISILQASGYGSDDINSIEYVSCSNGKLRYKITFENEWDGEIITGDVYILIGEDGKLRAKF